MKILTFTTLFPNTVQPNHGIFVEHRLRHLLKEPGIEAKVIAPVPWFPFKNERFGAYAKFAQVPGRENRNGIDVLHPRFPVIPKIGMHLAPLLLSLSVIPIVRRVIREGYDFDLIDAHYFYPDGVSAGLMGRYFQKPVVVTGRGTDIHLIPRYRLPRKMIQWAAANASGIVTVCNALKEELVSMDVPYDAITVLRNGVDLELFSPRDREQAKREIGCTGSRVLLSVGNLIELKGHHIIVQALAELADVTLLIVGDGKERSNLKNLADSLAVSSRVRFVGNISQPELVKYYSAADALVLSSSREGWANVLLEAMACGTPVIATNVFGTPEVVAAPVAGVLMRERSVAGVVEAYHRLFSAYPDRGATRSYAERFTWDDTSKGQMMLFRRITQDWHRAVQST